MAQTSLPQAGDSVGDSGPYTSDEWAQLYEILFTGDQSATQGVLKNYLNEFEVTHVGNTITIDTGAGFCYGRWLLNDTAVDIIANACAGIETRWDRVVLVQNNTAAAYNTNLLVPAAYAAGVPRNSCRLAILRGTCASPGVLPALFTGPNYYMVELARYQVTGGSAGDITDYRDYCNFSTEVGADWLDDRTRQFWVPALIGHDDDGDVDIGRNRGAPLLLGPYITLVDDDTTLAEGRFILPSDYSSGLSIQPVIISPTSGTINATSTPTWGSCDNSYAEGGGLPAMQTANATVVQNTYACLPACTPTGIDADDFILIQFNRYGAAASDTINNYVMFLGWKVTYTADS